MTLGVFFFLFSFFYLSSLSFHVFSRPSSYFQTLRSILCAFVPFTFTSPSPISISTVDNFGASDVSELFYRQARVRNEYEKTGFEGNRTDRETAAWMANAFALQPWMIYSRRRILINRVRSLSTGVDVPRVFCERERERRAISVKHSVTSRSTPLIAASVSNKTIYVSTYTRQGRFTSRPPALFSRSCTSKEIVLGWRKER